MPCGWLAGVLFVVVFLPRRGGGLRFHDVSEAALEWEGIFPAWEDL